VNPTIQRRIDRLLHDAEHKDSGAKFARSLPGDRPLEAAERMERDRDQLIAKALALDPDRKAEAWGETDLKISPIGG
jgi:hypothetical protein